MGEEFPVVDWGCIVRDPPSLMDDFGWLEGWVDYGDGDYTGEEGEGD